MSKIKSAEEWAELIMHNEYPSLLELIRDIQKDCRSATLQVAAKTIKISTARSPNSNNYNAFIDKDSILSLITHPDLKID